MNAALFSFLSNLHGVIGQFGSNISIDGMGQVATHAYVQMPELAEPLVVYLDDARAVRTFAILVSPEQAAEVGLAAHSPGDAKRLRDYLAQPSTRAAILDALADALAELEAMDTLEAFERCR